MITSKGVTESQSLEASALLEEEKASERTLLKKRNTITLLKCKEIITF